MSVVLAPGKLAAVKMLVEPVMIGSPVAVPKAMPGTICVPLAPVLQVLIWVKLVPKLNRCAPFDHVILALPCFSGVLRRVCPVLRKGLCTNPNDGAYPSHCAKSLGLTPLLNTTVPPFRPKRISLVTCELK